MTSTNGAMRRLTSCACFLPPRDFHSDAPYFKSYEKTVPFRLSACIATRVIGECCDHRGVQAETSFQPARDVVFPSAFTNLEGSRRRNAPLARIEPHHDLAQADQVPAAFFLRLDRQCHALTSAAHPNEKLLPAHSHEIPGMFPHSRL